MRKVCVIIPCYKVKDKISKVILRLLKKSIKIIIVDDKCPQKTGAYVKKKFKQKKILVIFQKKNSGVGGATLEGFKYAIKKKYNIAIKIDGDDQHDTKVLSLFIKALTTQNYDICKGYRFDTLDDYFNIKMPFIRLFGATVLTFILRFVSGNWRIKDVCHGFIGFRVDFLKKLDFSKIQKNFFFEQDILFHSVLKKAKIKQIRNLVRYEANITSNLKPLNSILPFLFYHSKNFLYRIVKS